MWHFSRSQKDAAALDPALLQANGITLNPLVRERALREARRAAAPAAGPAGELEHAENREHTIEWLEDQTFFSVNTQQPPSLGEAEQWLIDQLGLIPKTLISDNAAMEVGDLIQDDDYLAALR